MTALFTVIFINQWKSQKNHSPAIIGTAASVFCLILFGPGNFIIPAMILIILALTLFKKPIERRVL
jgi:4-azaleucine resistance transporter AzlC